MAASETLTQAADAVDGRLQASARTYGRLTDEAFEGAPLDNDRELPNLELVRRQRAHRLEGHADSQGRTNLRAVVHEVGDQRRQIRCTLFVHRARGRELGGVGCSKQAEPRICVGRKRWTTHVGTNASRFGSTPASQVAAAEFDCTPEIRYDRAGFSYRLVSPLAQLGAVLDASPVRRKLKSAILRDFYDAWASLRGPRDQLAIFARFDRERFSAGGCLTIAECARNGSVKLIEVGKALSERMGRAVADGDLMSEDPRSVTEAIRRCAHAGKPCYEQFRFDFGDGDPVTFERLLMPFAQGGRRITHVVEIAVFTGETQPRSKFVYFL